MSNGYPPPGREATPVLAVPPARLPVNLATTVQRGAGARRRLGPMNALSLAAFRAHSAEGTV